MGLVDFNSVIGANYPGAAFPANSYVNAGEVGQAEQSFEALLNEHAQQPPAQNNAPAKAADDGGGWLDRGLGALQAGFGVLETVGGAAFGLVTAETSVGALAGGAVALHGIDDIQAGLRQAWSGKPTETFTQQAAKGAAEKLGASPQLAIVIGTGVDLAAGGGIGGGEKAGVKALEEGGKLLEGGAKLVQDGNKAEKGLNEALKLEETVQKTAEESELPTIAFRKSTTPGIADNIEAAIADGKPSVLTRLEGRDAIRANRNDALAGQAKPPSTHSLDEYPFASSNEGGSGARVAQVPRAEQNIQGGQLSNFYQTNGIKNGDPFRVKVVP